VLAQQVGAVVVAFGVRTTVWMWSRVGSFVRSGAAPPIQANQVSSRCRLISASRNMASPSRWRPTYSPISASSTRRCGSDMSRALRRVAGQIERVARILLRLQHDRAGATARRRSG
jgi:hypothetical protein